MSYLIIWEQWQLYFDKSTELKSWNYFLAQNFWNEQIHLYFHCKYDQQVVGIIRK